MPVDVLPNNLFAITKRNVHIDRPVLTTNELVQSIDTKGNCDLFHRFIHSPNFHSSLEKLHTLYFMCNCRDNSSNRIYDRIYFLSVEQHTKIFFILLRRVMGINR